MIQKLHPTIKKCACGFIGTKTRFWSHFEATKKEYPTLKDFFQVHGEVPINQHEGDEWLNKQWYAKTYSRKPAAETFDANV